MISAAAIAIRNAPRVSRDNISVFMVPPLRSAAQGVENLLLALVFDRNLG
jgi:hypothetical protein